jgi:hypothetical protein
LVLGLVMTGGGTRVSLAQDDLVRGHQWVHRLLLVFTPSRSTEASRHLARAVAESDYELRDRDTLVGWFSIADGNVLGDIDVATDVVAQWRSQLAIEPDTFAVVLVGKDGGVKAHYREPPRLADVFALIDGMPMRRAELRQRRE